MTVLLLRTKRNGTERNKSGKIEKKERERKDLAQCPRSRTERNDLKTCPALMGSHLKLINVIKSKSIVGVTSSYSSFIKKWHVRLITVPENVIKNE